MKFNKKNFFKLALKFAMPTVLATASIASACNNSESANSKKTVKFATAQDTIWPLMQSLQPIIEQYNKDLEEFNKQEKEKNSDFVEFLPVQLQFSTELKVDNSESKLTAAVAAQLETNKKDAPSLILANQGAAFIANSYNVLLDLSKTNINKNIFNEKILKSHNELAGLGVDENKIYSIPFDVTDVDGLVFNLDLMYKIFEVIKSGGGTVSEESEIYKKAKEASTIGASIPENSIWNKIKAKSKESYKSLIVNDDTFKGIMTTLKFAKDFYDGLDIDFENTEGDAAIFTIDYQQDTFFKALKNETGKDLLEVDKITEENSKNTPVKYNIKDDKELQDKFKELYKLFGEEGELKQKNNNTQAFFNIRYAANGATDWASWDIRTFKTAFAYAPLVGINQTVQSPVSKAFFTPKFNEIVETTKQPTEEAKKDQAIFSKFATIDDILYIPQVQKNNVDESRQTYLKGGSNLIALTTNDKQTDDSTIRFLNYLFEGKYKDFDGKSRSVADYIAETSSYILPTKAFLSSDTETRFQSRIKEMEAAKKETKDLSLQAQYEKRINNLTAALITLKSALVYQEGMGDNYQLLNTYSIDTKSSSVVSTISASLLNATKKTNESKEFKTGEEVLKTILDTIKK